MSYLIEPPGKSTDGPSGLNLDTDQYHAITTGRVVTFDNSSATDYRICEETARGAPSTLASAVGQCETGEALMAREVIMRRRVLYLLSIVGVSVGTMVFAAPASASGPLIPIPSSSEDLGSSYCGFDVFLSVQSGEFIVHSDTAPDGTVTERIAGPAVSTLTNTATGKAITVNSSATTTLVVHPDGSEFFEADGPGFLAISPPLQAQLGEPGILIITGGRTLISGDSTGHVTSFSVQGSTSNGCMQLS